MSGRTNVAAPRANATAPDFGMGALASWLEQQLDDFRGPITASRLEGGQSNPTWLLSTPKRGYVLRRKPHNH